MTTQSAKLVCDTETIRVERHSLRNAQTGVSSPATRVSLRRANSLSVIVAPRLADGRILLAVRYCDSAGRWLLELPRLDNEDEDEGWRSPVEKSLAACGIAADGAMSILGLVRLDAGQSDSAVLAVAADDCRFVSPATDHDSLVAGVVAANRAILDDLVRNSDIECGATLAALSLLNAST